MFKINNVNFKCAFIFIYFFIIIISYCGKENALLNYINYSPPPSSLIQTLLLPAFELVTVAPTMYKSESNTKTDLCP